MSERCVRLKQRLVSVVAALPLSGESEQGARCYGELAQKSVLFFFFFFFFLSTLPVFIDVAHRSSYIPQNPQRY